MEQKEKKPPFDQRITLIDNHPHIYITPISEKEKLSGTREAFEGGPVKPGAAEKLPVSFFAHHIGKLLAPDKAALEEFVSIDKEIDTSMEAVRTKLQSLKGSSPYGESRVSREELKHRHFIEERNRAQQALFEDIVRYHREFGTGLVLEDLLSLHEMMQMEASHERACSQEGSLHELVECNLLTFLRGKAEDRAWGKLEDYIARFHISFPISPTMLDSAKPTRNEQVRDQQKRKNREDFLTMPALDLAELILGNIPAWVYSYPHRDSYLWQLTALLGVTAGLAADFFMKYLAVWEENTSEIMNSIQQDFMEKIDELHRRGESTMNLPDILSVSNELKKISQEQIPEQIWEHIRDKLGITE
jgi:hypothetical protein